MGTNLFGQYETKAITRRTVMRRTAMSRRAPVWYRRPDSKAPLSITSRFRSAIWRRPASFIGEYSVAFPRIEKMGPYCYR